MESMENVEKKRNQRTRDRVNRIVKSSKEECVARRENDSLDSTTSVDSFVHVLLARNSGISVRFLDQLLMDLQEIDAPSYRWWNTILFS
jgi:hypothetical protein